MGASPSSPGSRAPGLAFASAEGRWVLLATVLGSAIAQMTATVVNVALPAIGEDLGAEVSGLQWVVNGYLLTLAALILVGGSLGDHYGRRRIFLLGIGWFAAASLLCAVAPTIELLVAARVLLGVGGALMTPGSLAIIQATFRRADRARAIGAWAALGGVASAAGPLIGGWLIEAISWRAIFLLNLPLAVVAAYAAVRHVPESRDEEPTPLDVPGAALAVVALAGVTSALIGAPELGATAPSVLGGAIVGIGAFAAFFLVERRSAHPMVPLGAFANRQFSAANALTFVVYASLSGVFFLFVVTLQNLLGYSPIEAGAASLPITALMLVLSARSGALAERIGPRWPLTIGPVLIAGGMLVLSTIGPETSYVTGILPGLVVFGLGLATTVAPVTSTVLAAADQRHTGVASGINNAVARSAGLIAVAVLPWIAGLTGGAFEDPAALERGFGGAMRVTAALALAAAVLAFLTIRSDVLEDDDAGEDSESGDGSASAHGPASGHSSASAHGLEAGRPADGRGSPDRDPTHADAGEDVGQDGRRPAPARPAVARGCELDGPPPAWDPVDTPG